MGFHVCRGGGYLGNADTSQEVNNIVTALELPGFSERENAEDYKRLLMDKGLDETTASILSEQSPTDIFEQIRRAENENLLELPKLTNTSAQSKTAVSLLTERLGKQTAEVVIASQKSDNINRLISHLRSTVGSAISESDNTEEILGLPIMHVRR